MLFRSVQAADERYRGGPDRPFTREELHEKFTECAALVLSEAAMAETLHAVESLEKAADITALVNTLATQKTELQGTR